MALKMCNSPFYDMFSGTNTTATAPTFNLPE